MTAWNKLYLSRWVDVPLQPKPKLNLEEALLFDVLKVVRSILVCGGWVRDTMLGRIPNDLDFLVTYSDFQELEYVIKSRIYHFCQVYNVEFINLDVTETGRLGFAGNLAQYHLEIAVPVANSFDKEVKVIKFDIKAMFPDQNLFREPEHRDFKMNCLFYDYRQNLVYGRVDAFWSLQRKQIKPAINGPQTMEDPVRFLRAIRFKHTLGLTYSESTRGILRNKALRDYCWRYYKTPRSVLLQAKAPKEFKKMLLGCSSLDVLTGIVVDLYEFGWHAAPFAGPEFALKPNIFGRYFKKEYPEMHTLLIRWNGWDRMGQDRHYLATALIVSVALVSAVRFEGLEGDKLYWSFRIFFANTEKDRAEALLTSLRGKHPLLGLPNQRKFKSYMWARLQRFGYGLHQLSLQQGGKEPCTGHIRLDSLEMLYSSEGKKPPISVLQNQDVNRKQSEKGQTPPSLKKFHEPAAEQKQNQNH